MRVGGRRRSGRLSSSAGRAATGMAQKLAVPQEDGGPPDAVASVQAVVAFGGEEALDHPAGGD
jgi:hypothetical protein